MKYELVAGLETHVELNTKTKIFCSCATEFGGEPNTRCCPVCTGQPGSLPRLNERVVDYAILAGLALHCEISPISYMDRKNYRYPDLPKAYQITQHEIPLCRNGWIKLTNGRIIRVNRIHIEEDAGKLIHRNGQTLVDYNRGGVPLIEIVTEPDLHTAGEAREYVEALQLLMKYLGISDGKMQEGSLRCDVNLSVRPVGSETFGVRTEIKNMNSVAFMARAMDFEFRRQSAILEQGGKVAQETLRYNEADGTTAPMRGKEDENDYRYFREPDLPPVVVDRERLERLRASLPELPDQRMERYTAGLGLPQQDVRLLIRYPAAADYFDKASQGLKKPRTAANLIVGTLFTRMKTEATRENFQVPVPAEQLRDLAFMAESGQISGSLAKTMLESMLDTGKSPEELLKDGLSALDNDGLEQLCRDALEQNPGAVQDYLKGKEKALKALLGAVMRLSKGRADALKAEELLKGMINL